MWQNCLLVAAGLMLSLLLAEAGLRTAKWVERQRLPRLAPPIPLQQLGPKDGRGLRNPALFADSARWRTMMSDIYGLRYVERNGYRVLNVRRTYRTFPVNRRGFRGPEWERSEAPAGGIFLLGGSTAFSLYNAEATSLHRLLQQQLVQSSGKEWRVFCAAIPGALSGAELRILQYEVAPNRPDWVVVLDGFNDAGRAAKWRGRGWIAGLGAAAQRRPWRYSLLARVILRRLQAGAEKWAESGSMPEWLLPQAPTAEQIAEKYVANLRRMQRIGRKFGIKILFVLQPNVLAMHSQDALVRRFQAGWQRTFPEHLRLHRAVYPQMQKLLRRSGFIRLDAHERFSAEISSGRKPAAALFADVVHLTAEGNRLLARAMAARILQLAAGSAAEPAATAAK